MNQESYICPAPIYRDDKSFKNVQKLMPWGIGAMSLLLIVLAVLLYRMTFIDQPY